MTGWQNWINKGMNSLFDWYRGPSQNEFDYNAKQFIRNIPVIGGMFQADDSSRQMSDYLANRGLSWSDIRYNGTPFGPTYGSSLANVGVSAMNLYRSAIRKPHARKGGRGPPKGGIPPMPIGLAKEYVTPTGKYTRKYYADFRGGKIRGPSTYRRYRGY